MPPDVKVGALNPSEPDLNLLALWTLGSKYNRGMFTQAESRITVADMDVSTHQDGFGVFRKVRYAISFDSAL
jgi:hypothetical protein